MQSKKENEFIIDLEAYSAEKTYTRSFVLYEDYSQKNISEIIKTRRENFEKADLRVRRELAAEAESEVERFRIWLEEIRSFEPSLAHYYSLGLKSVLLGLPIGVQIAYLFDIILGAQTE